MLVSQPLVTVYKYNSSIFSWSPCIPVVSGIAWMLMGAVIVFGLIILMNSASVPIRKTKEQNSIMFEVNKISKPKPVAKVKPKLKPKPRLSTPRLSPLQGLDSSIGGIDYGMPEFDFGSMGDAGDSILGDTTNTVMTDDTVDVPPKPAKRIAMNYPATARKKGITGYVLLNLLIDQSGQVKNIKLLESSPAGIFDQAAIDGIKHWEFESAVYQGKKVQVWAQQKIRFDLG